jgi:hypothetical protein
MKLDLLTNATVVDDAIRFVSEKSKKNLKLHSEDGMMEESDETDYDEDKDQLEEKQEDETREITSATTNNVF